MICVLLIMLFFVLVACIFAVGFFVGVACSCSDLADWEKGK